MRLLILVVIYRRSCGESQTLRSLADCRHALRHSLVVVWDNSPDAASDQQIGWLSETFPRMDYLHDAANPGLASVYNRVISRYVKAEAAEPFDFLLLFDHDTRVPANYLKALQHACRKHPAIPLFLPLVRSREYIVSPSTVYGWKGFRWKQPRRGLEPTRHRNAINSGMAISAAFLRERFAGYDERLRFYGTDSFFMREYGKTHSHFVVLDCALEHDLSFFSDETVDIKLWRHRETVAALILLNENRGIQSWMTRLYGRVCSLRQAVKYRDRRFLA